MNLNELGEFGLIDRIAGRVTHSHGVVIGIGDDAAAVNPTPGCTSLVTTDMLIEGIHFDLAICDPLTLGRKSLAVNLSDIAAMGGKPLYFLLSLALPRHLQVEFLDGFISGIMECADKFGVALVGGDTCSSPGGLTISVTVIGEQLPEKLLTRTGARPGNLICVTGTLGDSALGLRLLRDGKGRGEDVRRHLDPSPKVIEGLSLAEAAIPTAMIDISDGLLADLGHILDLSGAGGRIYLTELPLSATFIAHMANLGKDSFHLPLTGGEDYELLFTINPERTKDTAALLAQIGTRFSVIGEIESEKGLRVIAEDGSPYQVSATGYNHFSS